MASFSPGQPFVQRRAGMLGGVEAAVRCLLRSVSYGRDAPSLERQLDSVSVVQVSHGWMALSCVGVRELLVSMNR